MSGRCNWSWSAQGGWCKTSQKCPPHSRKEECFSISSSIIPCNVWYHSWNYMIYTQRYVTLFKSNNSNQYFLIDSVCGGLQWLCHPQRSIPHFNRCNLHTSPSYQTAFNLFFQLARLQLLSESMPSNWQLASCALEQLSGIWGFPPHPTHLRPLTPDAIKDCSRLFPLGSDEKVGGGGGAYRAVDSVNATQPSGINRVQLLPPSFITLAYWGGNVSIQSQKWFLASLQSKGCEC